MRASGSRQPIIGWTTSTLSLTTWTCAANNRSLLRAISSTAEGRGRYPLPHTNTHTRRAAAFSSRPVRAKGQERAAESSMPRRFFPLSNAPLPTRSPYGVNDNHDSPPRATRRPLSFDAITRRSPDHRGELPASWIFLSLSLSLVESRYGLRRRGKKKRRMGWNISLIREEIGVIYFRSVFASYLDELENENAFLFERFRLFRKRNMN